MIIELSFIVIFAWLVAQISKPYREKMRKHPLFSALIIVLLFVAVLQGGTKGEPEPPETIYIRVLWWYSVEHEKWFPIDVPIYHIAKPENGEGEE